jgi:hypothetical protein
MKSMANPHPKHMSYSAKQFAELQRNPTTSNVASVQHFEGGRRPQGLMASNRGSANINWESSSVNSGEGSLAGYQKSNRGTLLDTGF